MEIWKPIDGTYEVSNLGRFRKGRRHLQVSSSGQVKLHGTARTAARLVATAFVPHPPMPTVVVRCRDGDRLNLQAENLYWATRPRGKVEVKARKFHEV